MRFAAPFIAVITAALLSGCGGSVATPTPNPSADAALISALKRLCEKTPPLVPIDPSATRDAVTSAANDDNGTLLTWVYGPPSPGPHGRIRRHGGLAVLTPEISSASPLVQPVTDAAEMALDMSKWYREIVGLPNIEDTKPRGSMSKLAAARAEKAEINQITAMSAIVVEREHRAWSDLAKIGVTGCLD